MTRGRFAPSPTGDLHLGNARTALLAWLHARGTGGRFVLRVEDLDEGRVRDRYRRSQLEDLRWLGLDWDEGPEAVNVYGPFLQSRRRHFYVEALAALERKGMLYRCWCTRKEIVAAASAPNAGDDEGPAYAGRCDLRQADPPSTPFALRFRVRPGPVRFHDELQGACCYHPDREVGDFVVRRKDGVPAYQLAVVVDDAAMGITDVVRGADLLPSTSRQLLLYSALEIDPPRWLHVPLLLSPAGDRLAKRERPLALNQIRSAGIASERLVGWLARSCGLLDSERECAPTDLVERYDVARIDRENTRADYPDWLRAAARTGVES